MKTTSSLFVLFVLAAGMVVPAAFADHSEVTIVPAAGSSVPGCEATDEGCYVPTIATVDVGGTVIMSNTDSAAHTFTAGTIADGPTGEFDTGLLAPGGSFEYKPTEVGEIQHYCLVHPWMSGTIVVQEVGSGGDMMRNGDMTDHDGGDHHEDGMMMDGMIENPSATGMISDGTVVKIETTEPMAGEAMEIKVQFVNAEHVNHDLMVMQNGRQVLLDEGAHHHEGMGTHMTAPLQSGDPVDVVLTFQGYGINEITGPVGEQIMFSNVVPEFGTIAVMVLAVAVISIVAVTARSGIVPRL